MKHIYILTVFLSICLTSFANTIQYKLTQKGWRWRNNDGSETTATWKAGQNKVVSYASHEVLRLRIEMINNSTTNQCQFDPCPYRPYTVTMLDSLQFSTDTTNESSWKNIGFNTGMPFVLAGSDSYVVQDEPTTPQLTGSGEPFSPGTVMVSDSTINGTRVPSPGRTEHEWVIRGTPNLAPKTNYYFRQRRAYAPYVANTNHGTLYASYPYLTTAATLAVQLNGFMVTNEGKKIKLQWSASPDEKADQINVQRSTDQHAWVTIASIKAIGTNYIVYDNAPPLAGTIYYRLQQIDKDGSYYFSATRSLKLFAASKTVASVFPNPASAAINFKLEQTTVKNVVAMLADMSGRVLITQKFQNIQAGTLNKMELRQKVPAGIYVLQLTGDNLSESIKVVVQ